MTWEEAKVWAASLEIGGIGGWRLPSALNSDGTRPCESICTDSEMGNLYYNVLGNSTGGGVGGGIQDQGPFSYVQFNPYWTSTENADGTAFAWFFNTATGAQQFVVKGELNWAWAVQSGAVPEPAAAWLFGSAVRADRSGQAAPTLIIRCFELFGTF